MNKCKIQTRKKLFSIKKNGRKKRKKKGKKREKTLKYV